MWIELSNIWIVLANIIAIPIAHFSISWMTTSLPLSLFTYQNTVTYRAFELYIHHHIFHTRKWKQLLPDGASWVGGFPKGNLTDSSPEYLLRFISETKRGEFCHWLQIIVISSFIIWNPWPANIIIVGYAILSNLPCVLNLRYTRLRLMRVVNKQINIHHD